MSVLTELRGLVEDLNEVGEIGEMGKRIEFRDIKKDAGIYREWIAQEYDRLEQGFGQLEKHIKALARLSGLPLEQIKKDIKLDQEMREDLNGELE